MDALARRPIWIEKILRQLERRTVHGINLGEV